MIDETQDRMVAVGGGAGLHIVSRGSGPLCLVLCHIGTRPYERLMPAQLSDRFRLAFVELRGCGKSTGAASDLDFDLLAADLEAVRRHFGAERVAVFGHSILGALAIEHGRRCPASVAHVIATGTPPRGDMAWVAARAAQFFEQNAAEDRQHILAENLAALPADATPGQAMFAQAPARFFDPRTDARPLFAGADVRPEALAHLTGAWLRDWNIAVDADSLRAPIFLAHGRYDYTVPHVLWADVADGLPDATLRLFERSGHQPFFEEPDEFVGALTGWMAAHE